LALGPADPKLDRGGEKDYSEGRKKRKTTVPFFSEGHRTSSLWGRRGDHGSWTQDVKALKARGRRKHFLSKRGGGENQRE